MFTGIDLYSDTHTRPTQAMREAMARAEVGDEQQGEDPTTRALEEKVAKLLGFSSALFFPSATMANEIALQLHCDSGDELLAAENCHLFRAEAGGPAVFARVMTKPIPTPTGLFTPEAIRSQFTPQVGPWFSRSRLLSVENTTNLGGGYAWPMDHLTEVIEAAKALKLRLHLDGARFFNAVVRNQVKPTELARGFDSVTICLSKGLGCPTGAVLAFDEKHFTQVRWLKQRMGGALRQSGILAAAGIYALDHHIERLEDDHKNAQRLADRLAEMDLIEVEPPQLSTSTNMVYFRWNASTGSPEQFHARCLKHGVRFSLVGPNRFRAVTHLDVNATDIDKAANVVAEVCREMREV